MGRLHRKQYDAWSSFLRFHAVVVGRIERTLSEAGVIPLTSYDILLAVDGSPGKRLRMSEIADRVVLSRSGLTRSVEKLIKEGCLKREGCPEDRRGAFAVITEKGREALKKAWPVYGKAIRTYYAAHLTDEEAVNLASLFRRALRNVEAKGSRGQWSGDTAGCGPERDRPGARCRPRR